MVKTCTDPGRQKVFVNVCGSRKMPLPPGWEPGQLPTEVCVGCGVLGAGTGCWNRLRALQEPPPWLPQHTCLPSLLALLALQVRAYLEGGQCDDVVPPAMLVSVCMGPPRFDRDHLGDTCCGEPASQQASEPARGSKRALHRPAAAVHRLLLAAAFQGRAPLGRRRSPPATTPTPTLTLTPPAAAVLDCMLSSQLLALCPEYRPLKVFVVQLCLAHASAKASRAVCAVTVVQNWFAPPCLPARATISPTPLCSAHAPACCCCCCHRCRRGCCCFLMQCKLPLDPQYKLPKMKYKGSGSPPPLVIDDDPLRGPSVGAAGFGVQGGLQQQQQRPPLIAEVAPPGGEAPAFALLATKRQRRQLQQKQQQAAATSAAAAVQQEDSAAAAAPGTPGAHQQAQQLQARVEFVGKPATSARVTVFLPQAVAAAARRGLAGSSGGGGELSVAVCAERGTVAAPGCTPLELVLPFAVAAEGGRAELAASGDALVLTLSYRPFASVLRELQQEKAEAAAAAQGGSGGADVEAAAEAAEEKVASLMDLD